MWDGTSLERGAEGALIVISGTVFTRGFMIESMTTPLPVEVVREEDGSGTRTPLEQVASLAAASSGWTWDAAARTTLWVKLPAGAARALIRRPTARAKRKR